ncbi:acyltransferase family protein [Megalodesulfovibrio paquesii]
MTDRTVPPRAHVKYIHYFRGVAILCIVAVHTLWPSTSLRDNTFALPLDWLRELAFHNSTVFFVFISGFLFQHLSDRFDMRTFFRKKLLYVVCPYVVMSLVGLGVGELLAWLRTGELSWPSLAGLPRLVAVLAQGTASFQYWYIPFIMLVFAASPLLLRLPDRIFVPMTGSLLILPLFFPRSGASFNYNMLLYFFPIYLFGMTFRRHHEAFLAFIQRHVRTIAWALLAVTTAIYGHHSLAVQSGSALHYYVFSGLFYVQKLLLLLLCVRVLHGLQHRKMDVLGKLADFSFAIYFIHVYVDDLLRYALVTISPEDYFISDPYLESVTFFVLTLSVSTGLAVLGKQLLGSRSRLFFGS